MAGKYNIHPMEQMFRDYQNTSAPKKAIGGWGHIEIGKLLRDADGDLGEIVELADNNRWARLRMNIGGTQKLLWVMVRNCTKVES